MDKRYRVRNVPKELQLEFKEASKKQGLYVGFALSQAMRDWMKKHKVKDSE